MSEEEEAGGITYKWLDGPSLTDAEWARETEAIDRVIEARGWMRLNKNTSRIRIAEDADGKLAGFYIFQMIGHAEPLYVRPSMRGTEVADRLADDMEKWLLETDARGWVLMADSPITAKMAEKRGMVRVESPVYVKVN
jgi:Acetyltransferase (GNAT) family